MSLITLGQQYGTIIGKITDKENNPLPGASIKVHGSILGTSSDKNGNYKLRVPVEKNQVIVFSYVGYKSVKKEVVLKTGEEQTFNIVLLPSATTIKGAEVIDNQLAKASIESLDPRTVDELPTPNASVEKTLAFKAVGVFSNNELSSQYTVRGGNFDENLIYVNGIEIYRPFLVRSGRQEGLSFINPDLIKSIKFSSGGFAAQYGDKMSSVLDVEYKQPAKKFGGSAEMSLLGGALHIENESDNHRFTQIHGIRYRTNQYLLKGLDTQGNYKPVFLDYQGFFTYDVTEKLQLGTLVSVARNKYEFIPTTRTTDFGTINQAIRLTVFFDGKEVNQYQTYLGALTAKYYPSDKVRLNFSTSGFTTIEEEIFDIEGAYRIDELERDLGSDNFGNVAFNRGIGGLLNHARNNLQATVFSAQHKGAFFSTSNSSIEWGVKGNIEQIKDNFLEWEVIDSAGYSIPQNPGNREIQLYNVIKNNNDINSNRYSGFAQYSKELEIDSHKLSFTGGVRATYWSFNDEVVGGPRASLSFKPNWKRNFTFKAAFGYYYQPPFYREMRDFKGDLNRNIKAQRSIHYVVGMDYVFDMWNRPFKFTTEAYYKDLKNIIPYEIDNVRLRYYAKNNAIGYTYGIDFKINGEFVKGVESYASLSVLSSQEDIVDDFYYKYYDANGKQTTPGNRFNPVADSQRFEPGYVPRPTDQRVNFSLFFQDYLPNNPTLKVNLSLIVGTGLPFGPPSLDRHRDTLRIPPYRRVDLGMSKLLLNPNKSKRKNWGNKKVFQHFESIWLSMEVFNLLQVNNTISYQWVREIGGRQLPVPNYLTARQINVKLQVKF